MTGSGKEVSNFDICTSSVVSWSKEDWSSGEGSSVYKLGSFNLIKTEKDASRTKAIEIFPYFSANLSKKKDANKADAILIASYFYETYRSE